MKKSQALATVSLAVVLGLSSSGCRPGSSGSGSGALSLPPDDGGLTVEAALHSSRVQWVKGFILAPRGGRVLLCGVLADVAGSPDCTGPSLVLEDGVLWRTPGHSRIGSLSDGALTESLDDPEVTDGRPCAYGTTPGPCADYPGLRSTSDLLWTDRPYSVIGLVRDGSLEAVPADYDVRS